MALGIEPRPKTKEVVPVMWWNHGGWGAGDWLAMGLMMVALWALVISLVVWLLRGLGKTPTHHSGEQPANSTPDALLAERFARGEIDADEFTARRELLNSGTGRTAEGRSR